jgi:hydroxylamine dehydrogenase
MSSAMLGTDYGVFDNGRWYMAKNIQEIYDWLRMMLAVNSEPSRNAK